MDEDLVRHHREIEDQRIEVGPTEGQQRHRTTCPDREPANDTNSDGGGLFEGGRRLEHGNGNLLGIGALSHDLDHPSPHDEQRCGGLAFLAHVLTIRVLALVEDAGDVRELAAAEALEQAHLPQEVDEAPVSLRHAAFRRFEQRPGPERRVVCRAGVRPQG